MEAEKLARDKKELEPTVASPVPVLQSDAGTTPPMTAGWNEKDGFFVRSADDQFRLRITGQIQNDYRSYFNEDDRVDTDTFAVRRARLGIEADIFQNYEFRLHLILATTRFV